MARWLSLLALLLAVAVQAEVPVPPLSGRVVDLTQTLAMTELRQLESLLAEFEKRKGSQIALLLLPTTAPEAIESYAIRVAETWKIGRTRVDDGIIVLVAKDDRAMRIEVGYGLEGAVPDATAKRLIEDYFLPGFRNDNYFAGISAGLNALIAIIDGEPLPPPMKARTPSQGQSIERYFALFLFLIFAGGGILRVWLGRVGSASVVATVAAVAGWLVAGSVLIAALLAIAGFVLALFGGMRGMGGMGGYGGGSRGGGGFGGGGGGFGGGGASGRW